MKIIIKDLLEYFDVKESTDKGDTTATISVVGEDLGAALFKHFRENQRGVNLQIFDANEAKPTEGKRKGKWLDRWILETTKGKQVLYQTEIKSWCSRATGGISIPVDISEEVLLGKVKHNWDSGVSAIDDKKVNGINKVLLEMPTDDRLEISGHYTKEPLLILWDARSPNKSIKCFDKYKTEDKHHYFNYCWIFSCSLYLRQLYKNGEKEVKIDVPNAERRLKDLRSLFR